ncbi:MAG: RCC1 domain-containing protein, partial [Defluviitaleaceae bacterium]|nr:RCC1 domain-containing protein [Defluviitaleaceae bacterium]
MYANMKKILCVVTAIILLTGLIPVTAEHGEETVAPFLVAPSSFTTTPMLTTGWNHIVALRDDGTVWAWGCNEFGQLGDGTTYRSNAPVRVQGLENVKSIAAGNNHTFAI